MKNTLYISFADFSKSFNEEVDLIKQVNDNKLKKYSLANDFFSSFRLSEDFKIMPIENLLLIRGILDKFSRISNLSMKPNAVEGETMEESLRDMVGYALLIHAYFQCKKIEDFGRDVAVKKIYEMIDYIKKTCSVKNSDYSSKATNSEERNLANAIENFAIVEKYGLSTVEEGILARIAIKVQRLMNLIKNGEDAKSIGEEIVDFIVYSLILVVVLKDKTKADPNKVEASVSQSSKTGTTNEPTATVQLHQNQTPTAQPKA